jgi:hypothetical protein
MEDINAELARLRATVEQQTAALEEEKRIRIAASAVAKEDKINSAITLAMNQYRFVTPRAAEMFRDSVRSASVLDTDGVIRAGHLPLDTYVEREVGQLPGLLSKDGVQSPGNSRVDGYDMDNITPEKMKDPAEAARALAAIRKVARASGFR